MGAETEIPTVMSARDASFYGEIVAVMRETPWLSDPSFSFRPLLTIYHFYGASRVGKAVSLDLQFRGIDNLYILPPTAYVDLDDDANPTLKSLVSGQYAMDGIIAHLRKDMSKKVGEDSETCPDLLLSRVLLLGDGSARLRRDLHRS